MRVTVGASDPAQASMCVTYGNSYGKHALIITCNVPLKGRFVTVSVKDTSLSLCEVKVMAVPVTKQGWSTFLVYAMLIYSLYHCLD